MNTKIHKIGNSLSVYIPKRVAEKTGLVRGTPVMVRSIGRRVIVEPKIRKETLQDLLNSLTLHNQHSLIDSLIDFGPDVGKEIID